MTDSKILHIKNMVCPRCITAVKQLIEELEIPFQNVELGKIELKEGLGDEEKSRLNEGLETVGFSLI
jgi:copper chaperone CopZ